MRPRNLSRADVRKIEEGLNTNDLEVMIAYIDQIVGRARTTFTSFPKARAEAACLVPSLTNDHL